MPQPPKNTNPQSPIPNLQSPTSNPQSQCGSGTPGEDTDNDGLEDVTEYCLGTDPYYEDSDRDVITDTVEIEGFEFGGRTWTSDPFEADSNGDGLVDFTEWPSPVGDAPHMEGVDPWDPDGDDVPNLWDADNDGDDVPDGLDLSPFSHTDYIDVFSLTTQGGGFDGHQYIEIQLQPQNRDHLRYTTTALDWPHDELGQMQDRDDSAEDLRLMPMLKIRTNQAPDRGLARNYGVSAFENDDGSYDLYAPLMPVGDGGQMVAFYTKVAYAPGELDDIRWEKAQLVWVVQAEVDQDTDNGTVTESTPLHVYVGETFRVTGLQVIKSEEFQSAILGTPDYPDDDRYVFNLLFGLSATFLNNQEPDLEEIELRFDNPNTDIVETWGVTSTLVAVDLHADYAHSDEGVADMSVRVSRFLNDHNYPTDSSPSLALATQEEAGIFNLDDQGQFQPAAQFNVNLAEVEMNTFRALKREAYEYRDDSWETMSLAETLKLVQARYDDLSEELEEMHEQYPELSEQELVRTLYLFYSVWYIGQTRIIAIDGQPLAPDSRSDREVYDQFAHPADRALPTYLVEATDLGQPGGGLRLGADQTRTWSYLRGREKLAKEVGVNSKSNVLFEFAQIRPDDESALLANKVVKGFRTATSVLNALQCIQWAMTGRYFGITGWTKASQSFGWASRMRFSIRVIGVIGLIVSLAAIWIMFGLTTDFDNPIARNQALTYAIVASVFFIVMFAISLNPVGAILVALFSIVDLIVFFSTGGDVSISGTIIKAVAGFFYSVDELTYLKEADFVDFNTAPSDPEKGLVAGGRFKVTDKFVGEIWDRAAAEDDDLEDSYVTARFKGSAVGATATNKNKVRDCYLAGIGLTCERDVGVEYRFDAAGRDYALTIESEVDAKVYYQECTLGGLICWREPYYIDMPEDLEDDDKWDPATFYLDVLPDSLSGLWDWDELVNPDWDGDGLLNSEEEGGAGCVPETQNCTYPDLWDTDGDGLSDHFEFESQEDLGADPLNPDTDGDGLDDGFEYRVGTRIDNPDSDGDGLTDAEEVYHQDESGQWVGGWEITLPGWSGLVRVYSDPHLADADDDGLDDFNERANGLSPYAYNDAPRLTLDGDPLTSNPGGTAGIYVEPGETVVLTLTLESVGPQPITSTLTLCLPDFLTDIQGGEMSGDRTPARQPAPDCDGFQWSFAGEHTLQLWEVASTTVTTTVAAGLSESVSDEATATLPYHVGDEAEEITDRVKVVVDVDNPTVAIVAPEDARCWAAASVPTSSAVHRATTAVGLHTWR